MTLTIADYALIGDTETAALVGSDGSIDWFCAPRFDSSACFSALLGAPKHGRWLLAPVAEVTRVVRRYRGETLILETELHTDEGVVRLVDFMPIRADQPDLVRIIEGVSGRVRLRMELVIRFDYGQTQPWVRMIDGRLHAISGPNAVVLTTPVRIEREHARTVAELEVAAGQRVPFTLSWHRSYEPFLPRPDPFVALQQTEAWWRAWSARSTFASPHRDAVMRSLITAAALTYAPAGAFVAAPTASLPETIGGARNWDYRYCWLRDSAFTLRAFAHAGYAREAAAWRDWLHRVGARDPARLRTVYGIAGDREIIDREIDELPGYLGSKPVRIGNGASGQLQLDIYGELAEALYQARRAGLRANRETWEFERLMFEWLESNWMKPDKGLWEIRGESRQYTHSKVMAWVAFDRAVRSTEEHELEGPADRWRRIRDEIHRDVCAHGFDPDLGSFTQAYGSEVIDASLLLIPVVGFLPADDPRVAGTIAAVERELMCGGLVARYPTREGMNIDGQPGREGAFLACSFWLVDAYALSGRLAEANQLFDRVLAVANDVGLLSEEYDVERGQLVGNFPQVFSHVALVNSARILADAERNTR